MDMSANDEEALRNRFNMDAEDIENTKEMTEAELDAAVEKRYRDELKDGLEFWNRGSSDLWKASVIAMLDADKHTIPNDLIPIVKHLAVLGYSLLVYKSDDPAGD